MNFIDIHTHSFYQDPETTMVLNVFPGDKEKLDLDTYFSVGLHPWHADENTLKETLAEVASTAHHPGVIALGETGLDKAVAIPYNIQMKVFENHLAIAESLRKPMVIHCVRSYSEMLAIRKKSDQSIPWIFHWFNADEQTAEQLIRKNCYLSFGHMLFKEESRAFRTFIHLPPGRIFFETDDAGYSIQEVYKRAAGIRKTGVEELKMQIIDNFGRCFKITCNGKLAETD